MSAILDSGASIDAETWIDADKAEFRRNFNRQSFELRHRLSQHPLLQLPSLMQLAERTVRQRPADLYFDMGTIEIGQRWDSVPTKTFSATAALEQIHKSKAWFIFRAAQRDPEYASLLHHGLSEFKALIGPTIDSQIRQEDIIIFVTSPNRVTSYHIDRECNFLLQIQGTKTLYVFDREDREILPEEEIERFWAVDNNAAVYKPQFQNRARTYKFSPGLGVHIPVNCPHWLQNDDNVSVSLSINFQFRDSTRADIYRANYFIRQLGFKPSPPGLDPRKDRLKATMINAATGARRLAMGKPPSRNSK